MNSQCHSHQKCVSNALKDAKLLCDKQSLQLTDIRETVLKLVWQSHKPAKAYDLLALLAEQGYSAKPPTIYRALDFLLENGLIHKINKLNAYIGCQHPMENQNQHSCALMICQSCHEVTECCTESMKKALQKVADDYGFSLNQAELELEGLCSLCQQA